MFFFLFHKKKNERLFSLKKGTRRFSFLSSRREVFISQRKEWSFTHSTKGGDFLLFPQKYFFSHLGEWRDNTFPFPQRKERFLSLLKQIFLIGETIIFFSINGRDKVFLLGKRRTIFFFFLYATEIFSFWGRKGQNFPNFSQEKGPCAVSHGMERISSLKPGRRKFFLFSEWIYSHVSGIRIKLPVLSLKA